MRTQFLSLLFLSACAPPAAPDPAVIEPGVRREVIRVEGPTPAANPLTGGETPASVNGVQVVRYRVDTGQETPKAARAIMVLMPGFLAGAGAFDSLARAIVRRSTADAPLEAWAIDRRANLLEDRTGIDAALAAQNANLLTGYYFEGAEVNGQTFPGFLEQSDVDFESEWGMASTIADLHAVLAKVPADQRKARVVLAGHSLGATIVSQYAAWDFGGVPGHEELAGLVLIDGVTGDEGAPLSITQDQYETSGVPSPMGTLPSLSQLRAGTRYFEFPILEATLFPVGMGAAMRASWNPDSIEKDVPRAKAFQTIFLMERLPRFTNRAAFGLAFDAASCPVSIAAVNAGQATGGALTASTSPFGGATVLRPTEVTATYQWLEFDAVEPKEHTSLGEFAQAWMRPTVDFGEWYFPSRIALDVGLSSSLVLAPSSWPASTYGLKAVHGREISAPVLVEAAAILDGDVTRYDKLRAILPSVGAGRPLSGAARSVSEGFQTVGHPEFSHVDPVAATDVAGSSAAQWFDTLVDFVKRNTPEGGVVVP